MTICQQDSQNHSCCHAPLKPVYSPRPGTFLNGGPEEHLGAGARTGFSLPEPFLKCFRCKCRNLSLPREDSGGRCRGRVGNR